VDGSFNRIDVDSDYWLQNAIYQGLTASAGTMLFGQEMLVLPAFWINSGIAPTGQFAGKRFWMIDPTTPTQTDMNAGWHRHDAFYNPNGGFQDSLPVSANRIRNVGGKASSTSVGTAYSSSEVNLKALVNTLNTNTNNIATRGWGIMGFRVTEAIKLLSLFEYGSPISLYNAHVSTGVPYRGIGLWGATQLLAQGLYDDRVKLLDGVSEVTIPPIVGETAGSFAVEHLYGKEDLASGVLPFDDWAVPRNTNKTKGAVDTAKSRSLIIRNFFGEQVCGTSQAAGVFGYAIQGNGSYNALMVKWD